MSAFRGGDKAPIKSVLSNFWAQCESQPLLVFETEQIGGHNCTCCGQIDEVSERHLRVLNGFGNKSRA
ncbi:Protein of unknown function [Pyronema omphalodes CBS 100304]|uniref:Uncharacterized protein n=1 Tax=Pyronema omphalodes (strain CBS 100304) TaxID=1076935 RepID=U4L0P2_PYROM|nr:Protein of unknown function [Pyronema omphalodes CBS 100304]